MDNSKICFNNLSGTKNHISWLFAPVSNYAGCTSLSIFTQSNLQLGTSNNAFNLKLHCVICDWVETIGNKI